jgi:plasmid stabilization system protein ParE
MVNRTVEIQHVAKKQLWEAYKYIRKDSFQNAEKVKLRILESIKALAKNPEYHPLDKYCIENDGNFRAYEVYKYRISYYIADKKVIVLRIRHTKMNPLHY